MGRMSCEIECRIKYILKTNYLQFKFKLVFWNENKIGRFIKVRGKLPLPLCPSGIYKYKCGGCDATYIGKITQSLSVRIDGSKGNSYRSLGHLLHLPYLAINSHSLQKDHPIQDSDFIILDSGCEPDLHT